MITTTQPAPPLGYLTQTGAGTPMGELCGATGGRAAPASRRARDQAGPAARRGPRPLQGSRRRTTARSTGIAGIAAPISATACRGMRAALQLPRLALRRRRRAAWRSPTRTSRIPRRGCKDEIHIKAYPVEELGGLFWAYLGPEPRPLVPDWEFFSWRTASARSSWPRSRATGSSARRTRSTPCISNGRIELGVRLGGATGPYTPQHVKVDFSEFEYGFQYKRIRTDTSEHDRAVDDRPRLPVAERRCSPATTSSSACRSTTRTR